MKHQLVNYNEEGDLINALPPMLYEYQDQIDFVKELLQRRLENRWIPYDIDGDSWLPVEEYARNYTYHYLHGNETTNRIGC
jgi:hypothetical protein